MKKIISCIALLFVLAAAVPAQAQSFSWGVVGGLNLSKVSLKGNYKNVITDNLSTDNKAGWYIGPKVMFNTVLGLGVDAALEFSQRDLDIAGESEKYRTLEIPINLRYNIGLGSKAGVYVATGPQFGFALNNMSWDKFGNGGNFSRQNLNTTWNIGAGLRLLSHLEVGVGYNFALGKVGKALFQGVGGAVGESTDYELEYKTNTFQVQLAYFF